MSRLLVIDRDRAARESLGLACLDRGVGVLMAENLCAGVRTLLSMPVSLIVVDVQELRLTPPEHAVLFERVAPDVPVVVTVHPETSLEARVALELSGFTVVAGPVSAEDVVEKLSAVASRGASSC